MNRIHKHRNQHTNMLVVLTNALFNCYNGETCINDKKLLKTAKRYLTQLCRPQEDSVLLVYTRLLHVYALQNPRRQSILGPVLPEIIKHLRQEFRSKLQICLAIKQWRLIFLAATNNPSNVQLLRDANALVIARRHLELCNGLKSTKSIESVISMLEFDQNGPKIKTPLLISPDSFCHSSPSLLATDKNSTLNVMPSEQMDTHIQLEHNNVPLDLNHTKNLAVDSVLTLEGDNEPTEAFQQDNNEISNTSRAEVSNASEKSGTSTGSIYYTAREESSGVEDVANNDKISNGSCELDNVPCTNSPLPVGSEGPISSYFPSPQKELLSPIKLREGRILLDRLVLQTKLRRSEAILRYEIERKKNANNRRNSER